GVSRTERPTLLADRRSSEILSYLQSGRLPGEKPGVAGEEASDSDGGPAPRIDAPRECGYGRGDAVGRHASGTGAEPVVDVAAERHRAVSRAGPGPVAKGRPQSRRVPQATTGRATGATGRGDGPRFPDRLRIPPADRVPEGLRQLGGRPRLD